MMLCLAVLFACEEQEKFGMAEADKAFNFRMVPDKGSFNLADADPSVNFTIYSETGNIDNVEVVVELYQFLNDATTDRVTLAEIDGSTLTNDGSTTLSLTLADFSAAVGVDPSTLGGGDVFSIYNVVHLENGNVYPDTLVFGGNPFFNVENSFYTAGNTTSFTGQLNFPMVCPVSSPFTGNYTVTDDCELFNGTAVLTTVAGNPTQRDFGAGWDTFPGIGFAFDLTCGRIFVANQSIGLGCGGGNNVNVVTSDVEDLGPGTYDDLDDSEFTINVYYSNPGCFGGFDCTLTFTKQ